MGEKLQENKGKNPHYFMENIGMGIPVSIFPGTNPLNPSPRTGPCASQDVGDHGCPLLLEEVRQRGRGQRQLQLAKKIQQHVVHHGISHAAIKGL